MSAQEADLSRRDQKRVTVVLKTGNFYILKITSRKGFENLSSQIASKLTLMRSII